VVVKEHEDIPSVAQERFKIQEGERITTIRIKQVHRIKGDSVQKIGPGKKKVVRRIKPKDKKFSIGNIFWLTDGIYVLEEITNAQRCSKRRVAIFRPMPLTAINEKKIYDIYQLVGTGV